MQHRKRSGLILGVLILAGLVGATLTAQLAQAASGVGPYYAAPAWDQKLGLGRFLVLTNWNSEAVLDKETGLVWERQPAITQHTWAEARFQCTARTTGNRKGWSLPSVHELASLVRPGLNPALPTGHPFSNVQTADYWSVSTVADDPLFAWFVGFHEGGIVTFSTKTNDNRAWCVRGGMNAEAY